MNNTCPSPNCGAVYNLTPAHVGRSFVCKKCNSSLIVTAQGLELQAPAYPPEPPDVGVIEEASPVPRATGRVRSRGGSESLQKLIERLKTDSFTWLFGSGLVLVILFLFLPLIDQAKISARQAAIDRGNSKIYGGSGSRKPAFPGGPPGVMEEPPKDKKDDAKDKEKERKQWEETDKPKLMEEVEDARYSARTWLRWYSWGMMFGFICLGLAGLGYLSPQQTTIRRVVGSIVVCAQVLLIFIAFVIASSIAR